MSKKELGTNTELADGLRHGLFGSRETIQEAYDYASKIIDTLRPEDGMPAFTAIHVLMNTIADEIERRDLKEID